MNHSEAHSHTAGGAHAHGPDASRNRLLIAIAIIGAFVVLQFVGGLLSGSLSLLADAGHMLSDLIALVVALAASVIAARPATERHTYGFRRFEVLGALANAVLLIAVGVWIVFEGIRRLGNLAEVEVHSGAMLVVAVMGLLANIAALMVLQGGRKESINIRGAYLHVLGDTLGSVFVIIAAVVIALTGWLPADALASLLIAALIVPRAVLLLAEVVRVLSESAPENAAIADIREHLLGYPGVVSVHDLHAWQIAPGERLFSGHVVVQDAVFADGRAGELLRELGHCLNSHFALAHSTIQLEPEGHAEHEHEVHH